MQSLISLGHTPESAQAVAAALIDLLRACAGMDQKTVRHVILAYQEASSIRNTNISNCNLYGGDEAIKTEV